MEPSSFPFPELAESAELLRKILRVEPESDSASLVDRRRRRRGLPREQAPLLSPPVPPASVTPAVAPPVRFVEPPVAQRPPLQGAVPAQRSRAAGPAVPNIAPPPAVMPAPEFPPPALLLPVPVVSPPAAPVPPAVITAAVITAAVTPAAAPVLAASGPWVPVEMPAYEKQAAGSGARSIPGEPASGAGRALAVPDALPAGPPPVLAATTWKGLETPAVPDFPQQEKPAIPDAKRSRALKTTSPLSTGLELLPVETTREFFAKRVRITRRF